MIVRVLLSKQKATTRVVSWVARKFIPIFPEMSGKLNLRYYCKKYRIVQLQIQGYQ